LIKNPFCSFRLQQSDSGYKKIKIISDHFGNQFISLLVKTCRMGYKGDIYYIEQILAVTAIRSATLLTGIKTRHIILAFRICGNHEEAEELAQDSFLKAYRSLKSFQNEKQFCNMVLQNSI